MIKLIVLAIVLLCVPSGLVAAVYLRKYLSYRMRLLEDRRQRRIQEELRGFLD